MSLKPIVGPIWYGHQIFLHSATATETSWFYSDSLLMISSDDDEHWYLIFVLNLCSFSHVSTYLVLRSKFPAKLLNIAHLKKCKLINKRKSTQTSLLVYITY